jgi:hypothetical protein
MIKFNWKIIQIIFLISFIFQFILIAHRVSFDLNLISTFLRENAGLNQSIYSDRKYALHINDLIKKFEIKKYNLEKSLLINSNEQRIFEVTYPIRFDNNSTSFFVLNSSSDLIYYESNCNYISTLKMINYYECNK